jgi:hypothetical protein
MNTIRSLLLVISAGIISASTSISSQELESIKLNPPDKQRGLPFMAALSVKASAVEWSEKEPSLQDLSDLMWAANGLNRPDENKTTASTALNAHDIDVYVFMKNGVFVYDVKNHELDPALSGDYRAQVMNQPPGPSDAPIQLFLISNSDRFRKGTQEQRYEWGALDAGIVSQNISLFCAATGMKTRPRASMNKGDVRQLLNLGDAHYVFLNHPVGYQK